MVVILKDGADSKKVKNIKPYAIFCRETVFCVRNICTRRQSVPRGRMVSFHADRRRRSVRLSGEEGDRLCGKTNPLWKIQAAGRGRIFYINHIDIFLKINMFTP